MSDLLLEIGTEEIPARMIDGARRDLARLTLEALKRVDLAAGVRVSVEATPRRLALIAENLPPKQEDRTLTMYGPAQKIAFDPDGNATRAALGFAQKMGTPVNEMKVSPDGKLCVERPILGRAAADLLAEILPEIILGIHFPRSMHWTGRSGPRFIRPIRWIVALLDGAVVPFEIGGVASSNETWGHRRLGSGALPVTGADDYRSVLAANGVVLSTEERCRRIANESEALVPAGLRVRSNPGLLRTLAYETEFPSAVLGSFDPEYLDLPEEVLETVMLTHQKYFAVETESGSLASSFIAIANSGGDPDGEIRRGHERVLRARFNDARFFWEFDQRLSLADRVEELKTVTFQATLGSYWDKTESNWSIARGLAADLELEDPTVDAALRAVRLAKSDLTTEMVGEFPELQGKIGGLYARAQGESQEVADAIYDHYLPAGAADALPRSGAGQVAALADKLATLGGMFKIGLVPTGSKDPLALRRAAYGVIRIIVEGELPLQLNSLVEVAGAGENASSLRAFLVERLRHWLQESGGFALDVVQAVLTAGDNVPVDAAARARALARVRSTPDFESLAVSFKRIRNILEKAGGTEKFESVVPDTSLFDSDAEADLHEALERVEDEIFSHNSRRDYTASLTEIATLRPQLDRYFDEVLVMAEDEAVRRNRLAFLAHMLVQLTTIADFAAIAPDPSGSKP